MKLRIVKDGNNVYRVFRKDYFWTPWCRTSGAEYDYANCNFAILKEFYWNMDDAECAVKSMIERQVAAKNYKKKKIVKEYVVTFSPLEKKELT